MKLNVREICIFGLLGALLYASKAIMAALPNIHIIGVLIIAITAVYKKNALWPIYIFVLLSGLLDGFGIWWLSYLYIWLPLWASAMLIPENIKHKPVVYSGICALHGLLFGILYLPVQALITGLDIRALLSWVAAGFYFDLIHGIGNFFLGFAICPIIKVLKEIEK